MYGMEISLLQNIERFYLDMYQNLDLIFFILKSLKCFTEPEDKEYFSYIMEKHQRNATANGKIMNYIEQTFFISY